MTSKRIMLMIAVAVLLIASITVPALALLPNGRQAPNFQLNDLSGNSHKLSDYRERSWSSTFLDTLATIV